MSDGLEQPPDLAALITGDIARWVRGCLLRDMTRESRASGKVPPPFHQSVLDALAVAAGGKAVAASGSPVARVITTSWNTVQEAASSTGLSERRIRQLAETGQVIARKPGRDWQIDIDSLTNVLRRAA